MGRIRSVIQPVVLHPKATTYPSPWGTRRQRRQKFPTQTYWLRSYLCAVWPHVSPTILRDVKPRLPPHPRHPPKPARAPVRLHALSWFERPIFEKDSLAPAGRGNLVSTRWYGKGMWSEHLERVKKYHSPDTTNRTAEWACDKR